MKNHYESAMNKWADVNTKLSAAVCSLTQIYKIKQKNGVLGGEGGGISAELMLRYISLFESADVKLFEDRDLPNYYDIKKKYFSSPRWMKRVLLILLR